MLLLLVSLGFIMERFRHHQVCAADVGASGLQKSQVGLPVGQNNSITLHGPRHHFGLFIFCRTRLGLMFSFSS
jgi:hypothetical protein